MNTNELRCILTKDPKTRLFLRDVFALDHFKSFVFKHSLIEGLYIINDETSVEDGNHWILVYVDKESVVFMDSFAKSPKHYSIKKEIEDNPYKSIITSPFQIQSYFSNVCGGYVVYFSLQLCRQKKLDQIYKQLSITDFEKNDQMIRHFIYEYFPGHYNL